MRKIREVIGNSLASKRSLLHSSPQLAYGGELSSKTLKNKTLRNYLDIQWRTLHDSTRGKTISAVRPVRPCARPLRAAASSCRTFARHLSPVTCRDPMHLCGQPCGHSMTHRNLLPVRRGTPAVPAPLSRRSCTAVIPLQQPSVNTVETPENSAHMFTDHTDAACPESGCCESSLTVFSIVKNQKIVNTETRKSSGFHCADAGGSLLHQLLFDAQVYWQEFRRSASNFQSNYLYFRRRKIA